MPLWLPIAAAIAGIYALARSAHPQSRDRDREWDRERERPALARTSGAPVPSALEVFNAFLRQGQRPPREIAELAAAEARAAGIVDLAADIEHEFSLSPGTPGQSPTAPKLPAGKTAPIAVGKAPPSDAALIGLPSGVGGAKQAGSGSGTGTGSGAGLPDLMGAITGQAAMAQASPTEDGNGYGNGYGQSASPIPGVSADQWEGLRAVLAREASTYDSQRHVGKYRQDKRRLRELGIDPLQLVGDPAAQDLALEADLRDAHDHLIRGRVVDRVVGRPVVIPDMEEAPIVTLPGLLGVCAAAGLEHCASWLRSKADRVRYRHTTNLFLRCNAVGLPGSAS